MEPIIPRISREAIRSELTADKFLRRTNKIDNEIYIVSAQDSPQTMREIGRLREQAFRDAGGGTGKSCDIDEFDTMEVPCRQLIVWSPEEEEIIGAYRFILGEDVKIDSDGKPCIATSHMFNFSERFMKEILPSTLELGRSFVALGYQSTKSSPKALYALDNLWDGLGALTVAYPQIKYLFGKVTMYPGFGTANRDMVLWFLNKYFPDRDALVTPIEPLQFSTPADELETLFHGSNFKEDYKILNHAIRRNGFNIPPLVNAYMSLSPTMRSFGTAINHEFGEVEETGIFLKISEIFEEKKKRHIDTYHPTETHNAK